MTVAIIMDIGHLWRDTVAMFALVLIGADMAFVRRPPVGDINAWRVFFASKAILTVYIACSLLSHNGGLSWRAPLATVGVSGAVVSLLWLLRRDDG